LFRLVKFEFPYLTSLHFQPTNEIFDRHGCLWNWVHSDWAARSTTIIFHLYTDLQPNVQLIRLHEHNCAMAVVLRREE
jgi:hypothetical protein